MHDYFPLFFTRVSDIQSKCYLTHNMWSFGKICFDFQLPHPVIFEPKFSQMMKNAVTVGNMYEADSEEAQKVSFRVLL